MKTSDLSLCLGILLVSIPAASAFNGHQATQGPINSIKYWPMTPRIVLLASKSFSSTDGIVKLLCCIFVFALLNLDDTTECVNRAQSQFIEKVLIIVLETTK